MRLLTSNTIPAHDAPPNNFSEKFAFQTIKRVEFFVVCVCGGRGGAEGGSVLFLGKGGRVVS